MATTTPLGGDPTDVVASPAPGADRRPRRRPAPITWLSAAIGAFFAVPAAFVVVRTIRLDASLSDTWTEVRGPLWRTLQLGGLVAMSTAVLGTTLAWLTVRTDLPFRRLWRVALVLPLVLPSFVGAGAFIAGLAPGAIIHDTLDAIGITPPRRFRGLGASWLVLTAFTYPYVMMPVAARLNTLRPSLAESATLLGLSPRQVFFRITLPEIRPALLGGSLLVFLYSLSEFGAVQLLGYDTLTRVVFATRQADRATSFAAASTLLLMAVLAVTLERRMRGPSTPDRRATAVEQRPSRLGWRRIPALGLCALTLAVGLVAPITSLATWTRRGFADGRISLGDVVDPAINTATVGVIAAVVTVAVVFPIAVSTTRDPRPLATVAAGSVLGGFAIPGLVIALALAVITLNASGLGWLYQSFALLIIGYVIHFGSQALASTEQAVRSVPDAVREQGRLLEPNAVRRWWRVDLPMMRSGLVAGGGLVMLATVKELPATLLLSPLDFTTLATDIWAGFGEGLYAETGLASLVLIAVSASLTWLLVLRPASRRPR